jgi:hypothetical protein
MRAPRVHRRDSCGDEKSPRRLARACGAVRVNTEFFEDSVTRSQAFYLPRESKARFSCKQQEKYRRMALDTFLVAQSSIVTLGPTLDDSRHS